MRRIIIITLLLSVVLGFILVKGSETMRDGLMKQQSNRLEVIDHLK